MLKRIISSFVAVFVFTAVLVIAGCEKDEVKTHRHVEVQDQIIHQDTVVE